MNTKLLIALIVLVLGFGGYYAFSQFQHKQEIQKSNEVIQKIHNAPFVKGGY